ncbi:MAG: DUF4293 domain-containing protein [Saprospiraceae bacterium]|nr:DUF4293 domain-containing protein [Saprospiraceae bacterium]
MIQRIQSIWLLCSALFFAAQSFTVINFARTPMTLKAPLDDMLLKNSENPVMLIGSLLSSLLAFVAIFLFKNRSTQIIVSGLSGLIQIGLSLVFGFYIINQSGGFGQFSPDFGIYFGLIGLTANWLATRAIRKDTELVKSMDRLR